MEYSDCTAGNKRQLRIHNNCQIHDNKIDKNTAAGEQQNGDERIANEAQLSKGAT